MKYISYRKSRDNYQIRIKVGDKTIIKNTKTMEEALTIRDSIFTLYNLDKSLLIENNVVVKNEDIIPITFEDFGDKWLKYVKTHNATTTYSNYYYVFQQLNIHLKDKNPAKITTAMINNIIDTLQKEHNYSYNYVAMFKRVINAMYKYGIAKCWYRNNPSKGIINIGIKTKPKRPFTDDEMEKFFEEVKRYDKENGGMWYYLFLLYKQTGARRSEILALKKEDVRYLPIPHIDINKTLKYDKDDKVYLTGKTKNESSNRVIPISDEIANFVKNLDIPNDEFIFKGKIGRAKNKIINARYVDFVFAVIRERAGLDKALTLHCFRHTLASSLVLSNRVDVKTAMAIGGWSTDKTMLSVYAHSNLTAMAKALECVQ